MMNDAHALLDNLKEMCGKSCIPLLGVAPVERFEGAPVGHHPSDFLKNSRSVVVIGIPVMKGIWGYPEMLKGSEIVPENMREKYLQGYFFTSAIDIVNNQLNDAIFKLSFLLEEAGHKTVYFYPVYGQTYKPFREMLPDMAGIFSLRHAAVRAGLGEFGQNNLVLNPLYGPRVRFSCLITEAELPPSPILKDKVCTDCGRCIKQCGTGAISEGNPAVKNDTGKSQVRLNPVSRTNKNLCAEKRMDAFCFGRCVMVCPAAG